MKLSIFRTLNAVLEGGSLAAAARTRHLTPSAVSLQMRRLEAFLGQQLFDRSGLQVKPLPNAYLVAEAMHDAMTRLDDLRCHTPLTVEGNLHLGIIETMQPLLMPSLILGLEKHYPLLKLQIQRGKSLELTEAVKAGEIDAAVVGQPCSGGSARLHWFPLMKQPLTLIAPPQEKEIELSTLFQKYRWIRYDRETIAGRLAAGYIRKNHVVHSTDIEFDTVRAIMAMVSAGLGVSIVQLSEPGIQLAFPVKVIELNDAPTVCFSLVMRKSDQENRLIQALCNVFQGFLSL